jgi:hypothetical protein
MAGSNALFALLFLVGAGLQYNDPDPMRWIAIYVASAASCLVWGRHTYAWLAPALVALAASAWALEIALDMPAWVPAAMFEPMKSHGGAVELNREFFGLAIIVAYMLLLIPSGRKAWANRR